MDLNLTGPRAESPCDIEKKRSKSRKSTNSDPFELWCVSQEDKRLRPALREYKREMSKRFGLAAPVPAQIPKLPVRLHSAPHRRSPLLTTHRSLPTPRTLTPFLLITYEQALYFHALTHSFAQRRAAMPFIPKSLRTLSIYRHGGVRPFPFQDLSVLSVSRWQTHSFDTLAASLPSPFPLLWASFPLFSIVCSLFSQNARVGVSAALPTSSCP
jgi:hypothetical protein